MAKTTTKGGKKTPASGKTMKRSASTGKFVLGRAAFTKVSAVEGVTLSKRMTADFERTARMASDKRRSMLVSKYGKE